MNYLEVFRDIRTFVFDVDGVMTNSEIIVLENGHLLRKMSIRDGYALKLAIQRGYRVAVITGGKSSGVIQRLRGLGITDIYSGVEDKLDALEEFLYTYDLNADQVLFMGDDVPDYEAMRKVALPACPKNAAPEILEIAQYVSARNGGEGCVRDVIEKTLRIQQQWLKNENEI